MVGVNNKDTGTRGLGRQFSSRPRCQAREHASTVIRSYGPLFRPPKLLNGTNGVSLRIGTLVIHRAFTGRQHCCQRWQQDWSRDHQVCTGHSLLAAAYLHRIGHQDSATCPHWRGAEETTEHLVFHCPAHDQARRNMWPGDSFTTDPRRLWNYLEQIGAVTPPLTGNERERQRNMKQYLSFWDSS